MKYLISLVIFTCLSLQFGFSQVKKSYVDSDHSETTVVVKEDDASDIDILNSQFDINSVGLGEVIMIKTEKEPKEAQPEVAEQPTPKVVKEATKPAREVAALPKARKQVSEKYFKGSGTRKKVKKKRKKKRFKNRKFKKRKRRTGCPTF